MASYGTNNNPFGSDEPDKIQEARKQVMNIRILNLFHWKEMSVNQNHSPN